MIFCFAGENSELKQAIKTSANKNLELGAQVHNLEMDSSEKDSCIEKYKAAVKFQEGKLLIFIHVLTTASSFCQHYHYFSSVSTPSIAVIFLTHVYMCMLVQ